MICPKCGSENVTVSTIQETQLVDKHHSIVWWALLGWYWVPIKWILLTIPALIVKIFAPKRQKLKQKTRTVCVCQQCGHSWNIK